MFSNVFLYFDFLHYLIHFNFFFLFYVHLHLQFFAFHFVLYLFFIFLLHVHLLLHHTFFMLDLLFHIHFLLLFPLLPSHLSAYAFHFYFFFHIEKLFYSSSPFVLLVPFHNNIFLSISIFTSTSFSIQTFSLFSLHVFYGHPTCFKPDLL